jgi:ADP-ribose pyrophosphatase
MIIVQYRPPVEAFCVEFPAGLIDEGESPEQAAVRELKEETGYSGKVCDILYQHSVDELRREDLS